MKIFSSLLLLAGLGATFLACKKDDSNSTKNKTDLLTASAWVHESSGADVTGDGNIDFPFSTYIPACLLDNVLTFEKDGTAVADEGTAKCNSTDPQTAAFTWSFADNETALVIDNNVFAALNGKLKIKTLTADKLTLTKDTTVTSPFPVNGVIIVNLKH